MSNKNLHGRQYGLKAVVDYDVTVVGASNLANTISFNLPPGALLDNLTVDTITGFDSATSAAATVGDGTTTFASAVDVKTTGRETVSNIGKFYPTGGTITVSVAVVGATTVGRFITTASYIVVTRVNEVQQ